MEIVLSHDGKEDRAEVNGVQLEGMASNIDSDGFLILVTTRGRKVKSSDAQCALVRIRL